VIERDFELLPDSREVHYRWQLVFKLITSGLAAL
jgi:hypothetical protein